MTIHAGAALDRFPGRKYVEALHFAELSFRHPRPRPATLRKLRKDAPATLRVSLVVPKDATLDATGTMRVEALADRIAWVRGAADAVDAVAIVLPTGREITPGARDRDRLAAYVDALGRTSGREIVWDPRGLWERDAAEAFARKLGVAVAFDPLEDEAPTGAVGYARIVAIGVRSRISSGMLTKSVQVMRAAGYGTGYVAVDSARSFRDARTLAGMLAGAAVEPEADDELSFDDDE